MGVSLINETLRRIGKIFRDLTTFSLFLILVFFISSLILPSSLVFIESPVSIITGNSIQNRIIVILIFFFILLFTKNRYLHLFSTKPFEKNVTYIWIFLLLTVTLLLQVELQPIKLKILPLDFTSYIFFFIIISIIVPIHEELIYRGLLLLIPYYKIRYFMLIVSSLLFAAIHPDHLSTFWLGLTLGVLAIRYKNLLVPIVAHSIWNTFHIFFDF